MKLIAMVAAASALACSAHTDAQRRPAAASSAVVVDHSRPRRDVEQVPYGEIPFTYAATYHVLPDRRVLLAARDIYGTITGDTATVVDVDFSSDKWLIRVGGRNAGTLPELATFAQGLAFLTRWTNSLGVGAGQAPVEAATLARVDEQLDKFDRFAVIDAAALLDRNARGSFGDAAVWERRATAATLLNIQTIDRFGVADDLRARALADVAIARTLDPQRCAAEAAALTKLFGYTNEAPALERNLNNRSAIEAYLTGNAHPGAEAAAAFSSPGRELILAAGNGVAATMRGSMPGPFESGLETFAALHASIGIDAKSLAAAGRAAFYSAAYEEFNWNFDHFASRELSERYVAQFSASATGIGAQAARWMAAMIDAEYNRAAHRQAPAELAALADLGLAPKFSLLRRMYEATESADTIVAARQMFRVADSRPAALGELGHLAAYVTNDPRLRDRLFDAAVASGTPDIDGVDLSVHLGRKHDDEALRTIALSMSRPVSERVAAMQQWWMRDREHTAEIRRTFEQLIERNPEFYVEFTRFLDAHRLYRVKEKAGRAMIGRATTDIERGWYASTVADALEQQSRYDEAAAFLEPFEFVDSYNVIAGLMSVAQHRGDQQAAAAYTTHLLERYPGADACSDVAAVLWRDKKLEEAAALLDARSHPYAIRGMRFSFPRTVVREFSARPAADMVRALEPIVGRLPKPVLEEDVAEAWHRAGDHEREFAVAEMMCRHKPAAANDADSIALHVRAWRALHEMKGESAANEWLRPRVPPPALIALLLTAHEMGEHQLVLDFAAGQPRKPREVEFMEALALVALRIPHSDPRWQALAAALTAQPPDPDRTSFQTATKYLLGLVDENALFAWGNGAGEYDEYDSAVYVRGVKLAAGGHGDDAIPWIAAAASFPRSTWPCNWARALLTRWSAQAWNDAKTRLVM